MFAPSAARLILLKFHAWLDEVEQIPRKASEPAIQAMRFAWHRDAVGDLFASPSKVRRHDAYEGLADAIATGQLDHTDLVGIIDAIEDGLDAEGLADLNTLISLVDAHHGRIMRLSLQLIGAEASEDQVNAAGRAIGLSQWIRDFAFRAGRQLALIPDTDLHAAGLNSHRLATGREPELARRAVQPIIVELGRSLTQLGEMEACPAVAIPILGPARLARATLKHARKANDLYRTDFSRPLLVRQWDLLRASLSGRL